MVVVLVVVLTHACDWGKSDSFPVLGLVSLIYLMELRLLQTKPALAS